MAKNIPRLYVEDDLEAASHLYLSKDLSHYVKNVMRRQVGDTLLLFNGRSGEWEGHVESDAKKCVVKIQKQTKPFQKLTPLALWFTPLKPQNLRFLIEKATELGVTELHPVVTDHTAIRQLNEARLRAQVIEAAEQCGRVEVPRIFPLCPLSKKLDALSETQTLVWGDERQTAAKTKFFSHGFSPFLVGPEGGFSAVEFQQLDAHEGCQGISLGPHILRAETAAIKGLVLGSLERA